MKLKVFLGYPRPFMKVQEEFVNQIRHYLKTHGFDPRTLGVTEYDMDAPLVAIRRLMLESNGLITIAFRRTYIEDSIVRHITDIDGLKEVHMEQIWLTTPWAHIEPAMAYQIGMPILVFREQGVLADGILEKGVVGLYMPEFDLAQGAEKYFESKEWENIIEKWEIRVRDFANSAIK